MTPLYKVLTEGNTPSLPRFIGNCGGFFNADRSSITKMSFLEGAVLSYPCGPAYIGCLFVNNKQIGSHGTSFAYMFHKET